MALKPETLARLQGILDGTIIVPPAPPADLSKLKPETLAHIQALLNRPSPAIEAPQAITIEEPTMADNEPDEQELRYADEVIKVIAAAGHGDYSEFRREIALDIYTEGHFGGNDTASFVPSDYDETSGLQDFTVYQEDHYDQHMDDDEDKPDHDDMVADVPNGYLFMG